MPTTSSIQPAQHQSVSQENPQKDKNTTAQKTLLTKNIISVSPSSEAFVINLGQSVYEPPQSFLSRLTGWLPFIRASGTLPEEQNTELQEIISDGKKLQQLAEENNLLRQEQNELSHQPTSGLKGKKGVNYSGQPPGNCCQRFRLQPLSGCLQQE